MQSPLTKSDLILKSNSGDDIRARLYDTLFLISRYWPAILIWSTLVFAASFAYLQLATNTYTAFSSILLDPRKPTPGTTDSSGGNYYTSLDSAQADSQMQVLKSERLLKPIFNKLGLSNWKEFNNTEPTLYQKLFGYIFGSLQPSSIAGPNEEIRVANAFNSFASKISVKRIGQSYVLEVWYYSTTPETAAKLANSIVMEYIRQQVESKSALVQNGTEYLQGRIAKLQAELDVASKAVQSGTIPDYVFPDADARVISAAAIPLGRYAPQKSVAIAFAVIGGPMAAVFAVLLVGLFKKSVKSPRQLRMYTDLPCLAIMPKVFRKTIFSSNENYESPLVGDYSGSRKQVLEKAVLDLRAGIIEYFAGRSAYSLAIVSHDEDMFSHNLGLLLTESLSDAQREVVFIDGADRSDGMNSAVKESWDRLGSSDKNYPNQDCKLGPGKKVPVYIGWNHLINLARREIGTNLSAKNLYATGFIDKYIRDLGPGKIVIICPPSLSLSSDAKLLRGTVHSAVLVVDGSKTSSDNLIACEQSFRNSGVNLAGVVLIS